MVLADKITLYLFSFHEGPIKSLDITYIHKVWFFWLKKENVYDRDVCFWNVSPCSQWANLAWLTKKNHYLASGRDLNKNNKKPSIKHLRAAITTRRKAKNEWTNTQKITKEMLPYVEFSTQGIQSSLVLQIVSKPFKPIFPSYFCTWCWSSSKPQIIIKLRTSAIIDLWMKNKAWKRCGDIPGID